MLRTTDLECLSSGENIDIIIHRKYLSPDTFPRIAYHQETYINIYTVLHFLSPYCLG